MNKGYKIHARLAPPIASTRAPIVSQIAVWRKKVLAVQARIEHDRL